MQRQALAPATSLILTVILIGLAAMLKLGAAWGLNHPQYIGDTLGYLLGFLIIALAALAFTPKPLERATTWLAGRLWNGAIWLKAGIAAVFTAIFFLFRVSTAFLGDGWFLLNIFGRNEQYTADLIKPLSVWAIKQSQQLLGGYTFETSLLTFQTFSIVAGFFVVYNLITIAGLITESIKGRLFALGTLLFSGWMLLFCGYIEYYPILWLAASFFIKQAIKCAQGNARAWSVWLPFLIAVTIHAQALYFLPGLLFLHARKPITNLINSLASKGKWVLPAVVIVIGAAAVLAAGVVFAGGKNPLMPLLPIGHEFPNYAVVSIANLAEIANLILLCIPSAWVLVTVLLSGKKKDADHLSTFLSLLSLGSLFFLIAMNPKLGLARDWDLMSLTLLAPLLWVICRISDWERIPGKLLAVTVLLSFGMSFSYVTTNVGEVRPVRRHFDLLKHYGAKDRPGWVSFERYLQTRTYLGLNREVSRRLEELFPYQRTYDEAIELLVAGQVDESERLIEKLVEAQPDHGQYLAALGDIRVIQVRLPEAIALYEKAIKTHPHHRNYFNLGKSLLRTGNPAAGIRALEESNRLAPGTEEILVQLCRGYAALNQLEQAKKFSDELLAINPHSPDGLIIAIISAVQSGERTEATRLYRLFLQHGRDHKEYEAVKQSFAHLLR
jgi:tetratricopeptide (TPR) repeat protein